MNKLKINRGKNMLFKKCKMCDAEIGYYPSTNHKKIYCSAECRLSGTKIKVKCPICNKDHFIHKCKSSENRIKPKFCSERCFSNFLKKEKDRKFLKKCNQCGKSFYSFRQKTKSGLFFCSQDCSKKYMKGENSPFWNGGTILTNGYKAIKINGKYIYEHRLVIEKHIKRKLKKTEHIHHIDKNKLNNDISNLKLMSKEEHDKFHSEERKIKNSGTCI